MKMKWRVIVLALSVTFAAFAQEEKQSFSLQEAVSYALENNKTLKMNRYDVEASESAYKETRAGWMPQVEGSLDYMTYFGYEMAFDLTSGSDYSFTDEQQFAALAAADATVAAYSGDPAAQFDAAQYVGGAAYEASLQEHIPATTIDMTDQSTAKIQVGQVLFNGQLLVGLRAARLGMEMAEKNVENSELDTKALVTEAYYNVLVTQETLEIIELNLSDMEALMEKTQALFDAGVAEQTDVDQLRVQYNSLRNTRLSMDRSVQITHNLLRFYLGIPVNSPIELTDDLALFIGATGALDMADNTFDINNNLSYQLMDKQVELSEEMVDNERMSYVPSITAFYAYNAKILTSGFDTNPNHMAGVTMTVPIFSSGQRKEKLTQSKIELEKTKLNRSLVQDQLELQEIQLRYDFQSKYEQFLNQKENVEVSKRVYVSYENKFTQGVASSMDLTQANTSYLKAESDYLASMLDLLKAKVAFDKLLNQL